MKLEVAFQVTTGKVSEVFNKPVFAEFALDRSSHSEVLCKKRVLTNFAKIHRKTPVPESF